MRHEIGCTAVEFWDAFLDRTYGDRLFKAILGFREYEVVDHVEAGGYVKRFVLAAPRLPVIQRMYTGLFGGFRFLAIGKLDRAGGTWHWRQAPRHRRRAQPKGSRTLLAAPTSVAGPRRHQLRARSTGTV